MITVQRGTIVLDFQNSRIWGPGSQQNPGIGRFPLRNRDFGGPKPQKFRPAAGQVPPSFWPDPEIEGGVEFPEYP